MVPRPQHAPAFPSAQRSLDVRFTVALVLFAGALSLGGYLLWNDGQAHAAHSVQARVLGRTLGKELQLGSPALLANKLARAYLQGTITLQLGDKQHRITRSALGVEVDLATLAELLRAVNDPRSPLRRLHAQQHGDAPLDVPLPARLRGDRAERWVRSLSASVDQPVRTARVQLKTFGRRNAVIAAQPGRQLDVDGTLDALSEAVFDGSPSVQGKVRELAPVRSNFAVDAVDVSRVLGSFESGTGEDDAARRAVVEAAVRKLDGALIAPGEVFDVRAQLGELHGAGAFKPAATSAHEGDRVEAALSQVASTLYAAALFTGLPIVEQHAYARPSLDIELGFDAALNDHSNLRFQNDLRFPIALSLSTRDGRVRVALRGSTAHTREVDVERAVEELAAYSEVSRPDDTLPSGAVVLVQRGRPGLRVELTRYMREHDEDSGREEQRSAVYAPSPRIVRLGHGGSVQVQPASAEPRAELLVDEFVGYGMRPGFELPQEIGRRAGHTGAAGWTTSDDEP